jgi:hypothetical protein
MGPPPDGAAASTDPYAWQSMNICVPQSAYGNANTAVILQVSNGGWCASPVRDAITEGGTKRLLGATSGRYVKHANRSIRSGIFARANERVDQLRERDQTQSIGCLSLQGCWARKSSDQLSPFPFTGRHAPELAAQKKCV